MIRSGPVSRFPDLSTAAAAADLWGDCRRSSGDDWMPVVESSVAGGGPQVPGSGFDASDRGIDWLNAVGATL